MTAKKTAGITNEYLEKKLKELEEQRVKIEDRIEQYTQMWERLQGAIELTRNMLEELTQEPNERVAEEKQ